ncbi:MAG: hypothetical protein AAGM46_27395, partial [Cyanobacteria bacterium J06582_2]
MNILPPTITSHLHNKALEFDDALSWITADLERHPQLKLTKKDILEERMNKEIVNAPARGTVAMTFQEMRNDKCRSTYDWQSDDEYTRHRSQSPVVDHHTQGTKAPPGDARKVEKEEEMGASKEMLALVSDLNFQRGRVSALKEFGFNNMQPQQQANGQQQVPVQQQAPATQQQTAVQTQPQAAGQQTQQRGVYQSRGGYGGRGRGRGFSRYTLCFRCERPGHIAANCPHENELWCTYCRKIGHQVRNCMRRKMDEDDPKFRPNGISQNFGVGGTGSAGAPHTQQACYQPPYGQYPPPPPHTYHAYAPPQPYPHYPQPQQYHQQQTYHPYNPPQK